MHVEHPTEGLGAVPHRRQPELGTDPGGQAAAVVANLDAYQLIVGGQGDGAVVGCRMSAAACRRTLVSASIAMR